MIQLPENVQTSSKKFKERTPKDSTQVCGIDIVSSEVLMRDEEGKIP